jgi:transposase-like protein
MASSAAMSRSTAAAEKWRRIIDEQVVSGQTMAQYCRQRGIPASSLFFWRRRLKRAAGATAFVEAKLPACSPEFSAYDVSSASIEILCAKGRRIGLRKGFDPNVLREAVQALEGLRPVCPLVSTRISIASARIASAALSSLGPAIFSHCDGIPCIRRVTPSAETTSL